ncbi:MAG TPA: hypothetical protein VME41_14075 [Stellaceae bacterium]|nr:hypothetical protein [Stellaceae bacterium]
MPKASANIAVISAFHNLSAGDLADQLGTVKAEIAALQSREKALRDELVRRGEREIEGANFSASIADAVRWTLDTKAVQAEMGADWYDAHCRQSLVTTVTVRVRAAARLAA